LAPLLQLNWRRAIKIKDFVRFSKNTLFVLNCSKLSFNEDLPEIFGEKGVFKKGVFLNGYQLSL
jgi:hypothetical protein